MKVWKNEKEVRFGQNGDYALSGEIEVVKPG